MKYNKHQFQKTNDKKILHKVRKHWVVISLAMLMAFGSGALVTHTASANADASNGNNNNISSNQSIKENLNSKLQNDQNTVNSGQSGASKQNANSNINLSTIQQKSKSLYGHIMNNAYTNANQNVTLNRPKMLLDDSQSSSNSNDGVSDSHIENNNNPRLSKVMVKYIDTSNGNQVVNNINQTAPEGDSFDMKGSRSGGATGYHYVDVKGATTDIPNTNLDTANEIPFPQYGKTNIIDIEVAKDAASTKVPSTLTYVYQRADNDKEIDQVTTTQNSNTAINDPQSYIDDIPDGYKLVSATGDGTYKAADGTYVLPSIMPAGESQVFINVAPIVKPVTNSEIEYVDEGNGQIVGAEKVSGTNGDKINNFDNFEKLVPSGYTYDSNNPLNNGSHWNMNYAPGNIDYLYVKSNKPDDKTNGYLNVIFKDVVNNKIINQSIMMGKVGTPINTNFNDIDNLVPQHYVYDSADPNNQTVSKYTNNLQDLVYYVKRDNSVIPSDVNENITYEDYRDPSIIYGSTSISGNPGSLIDWGQYSSIIPENTEFVSLGQHDSQYVDNGSSVVYVKHISTAAQPITVQYINQHGQKVVSDKVNGAYGTNYSDITKNPASLVPQGYNLNDNNGHLINQNLNYTIGSDAQTINVFVNGDHYQIPLVIHRIVNGEAVSDAKKEISGRVGDNVIVDAGSYNPDNSSDVTTSNNQTVTMTSTKDPNGNVNGAFNPSSVTFKYKKINYNIPGYDPQLTPSDNGDKSDYHPSDNTPYPSDNPSDPSVNHNGDKVPSGYTPGWIPVNSKDPNGKHTNGYLPNDHIPKGYVPGYVPNGKGGYVPGYVDPNKLPTGSNNAGKIVPKYVAGTLPNGHGGKTAGLVPAGNITIHYVDSADPTHHDIDTEVVSGQPSDDFNIESYTNNIPSGYSLSNVDYGTGNYSNTGTPIIKFNGNNQDINVMLNKFVTAKLDYVDKNDHPYPGMSVTLNGTSGSKISNSDYENYLPLGYVLDSNQPSSDSNNNWKLLNGATYTIRVDQASVIPNRMSDNYGLITIQYKDTNRNDANYNKVLGEIDVLGKDGTHFNSDTTDFANALSIAPAGYSDVNWDDPTQANDMKFNKNDPQSLVVKLSRNSNSVPMFSNEVINYIDADNNKPAGRREIRGVTNSKIDWSPYEHYLPANGGQYWSFDRLGTHNIYYGDGNTGIIYVHPALRIHHNENSGYNPDSTHNTGSDYFSSDDVPYTSDAPSDPDLIKGRADANNNNAKGGRLPAHYVPGWIPTNPSQPDGIHKPGYIPSDNIPTGYVPGEVPNGKGGYVPGYVPSDVAVQPSGSKNDGKTVPKYVPGTVSDGSGHKVPGMVPSTNSMITIHYIDVDNNDSDIDDVNLTGSFNQSFDVTPYQMNIPQGYRYIQTNYGNHNFNTSGVNSGTPVTSYDSNNHDINIMVYRVSNATINYVNQDGDTIVVKNLSGNAGSSINKSDYVDFIPYGYSLSNGNATEGTWKYDNSSDVVHLTNNYDAAKTPSDNDTGLNLGYINLVYKDINNGKIVGSYATSHTNGTPFTQSDTTDVTAFTPTGYQPVGIGYADPNVGNLQYKGGQTQNTVINVTRMSDGNGNPLPQPKSDSETIQYVDADSDTFNNNNLKGKVIATIKLNGKPGKTIDYSKFQNNLPSAYGGNWAYDFMGSHGNAINGHIDTIYIRKAKPAQQYGLITINYKDAKTGSDRGTNSIMSLSGSSFDISKYESNIPNSGNTQSDEWTFNHASDVPNFFNSDSDVGQKMIVYVNEPEVPNNFGTITVNYVDANTGHEISSPLQITGTNKEVFDPTSFENNIPQGMSFESVDHPIYSFVSGKNQTMTVKVSANG